MYTTLNYCILPDPAHVVYEVTRLWTVSVTEFGTHGGVIIRTDRSILRRLIAVGTSLHAKKKNGTWIGLGMQAGEVLVFAPWNSRDRRESGHEGDPVSSLASPGFATGATWA